MGTSYNSLLGCLLVFVSVQRLQAQQITGVGNHFMKDGALNGFTQTNYPHRAAAQTNPRIVNHIVTSSDKMIRKLLKDEDRDQCRVLPEQKFPCKNRKASKSIPTSVHRLRPADIQVVGALGDSLTVGVGARAGSVLDIAQEYRGVSFSIGGERSWREIVTLPNILKLFNSKLYGASSSRRRGYNYAVAGATSLQLIHQAKRLVRDMSRDPYVKFHQDWKMITILIGHNDACTHTCNSTLGVSMYEDASVDGYVRNIRKTLDFLQKRLPRTFVNLVPIADVTTTLDLLNKPGYCHLLHWYFCPCLFDTVFSNKMSRDTMKKQLRNYVSGLTHVIERGDYDTRDDFTVVIQPSLVNGIVPKKYDRILKLRIPDLSFFAPDCFHFSQKLHALVSRSLWNNLLQPHGDKSTSWRKKEVPFLCPSSTAPFIATRKNSGLTRRTRGSLLKDWIKFIRGSPKYQCTL